MHESIQPVVLVGGASRRFGRDKLREPVGDGMLVDRPIGALRELFGARVAVVGECDGAVAGRGDLVIPDRYPGVGPIGGIVSALEATGGDVFVLAGDLPRITAEAVRTILIAAEGEPERWAVLAVTDRVEPCIGLYRVGAAAALRERMKGNGGARSRLFDAIGSDRRLEVAVDPREAMNANTIEELRAAGSGD